MPGQPKVQTKEGGRGGVRARRAKVGELQHTHHEQGGANVVGVKGHHSSIAREPRIAQAIRPSALGNDAHEGPHGSGSGASLTFPK